LTLVLSLVRVQALVGVKAQVQVEAAAMVQVEATAMVQVEATAMVQVGAKAQVEAKYSAQVEARPKWSYCFLLFPEYFLYFYFNFQFMTDSRSANLQQSFHLFPELSEREGLVLLQPIYIF
jgi:hypothetical protein